jgi:hypothetical protein
MAASLDCQKGSKVECVSEQSTEENLEGSNRIIRKLYTLQNVIRIIKEDEMGKTCVHNFGRKCK